MRTTLQFLRISCVLFILLTMLTGILYPALITGVAQALFANKANGSFISQGSLLIGQPFDKPEYFWGRPSATAPFPNNAQLSTASNLGPTNPALVDVVKARIAVLQKADPTNSGKIPVDLVTASGSGLDPDISPDAAYYQAPRIAKLRRLAPIEVDQLIEAHISPRQLFILGEPRVNVLELNIALDELTQKIRNHV